MMCQPMGFYILDIPSNMVPKGAKMVGKAAQQEAFDSFRRIQCQGITSPRPFLYGTNKTDEIFTPFDDCLNFFTLHFSLSYTAGLIFFFLTVFSLIASQWRVVNIYISHAFLT